MIDMKMCILDIVLNLFNCVGECNVIINYIVEGLGISSGNFYYYYCNKVVIVVVLFECYQEQICDLLMVLEGLFIWQDKMCYFEGILEFMWQVCFLYWDLVYFFYQDVELCWCYKVFVQDSLECGLVIYCSLCDSGLIQVSDEELCGLLVNIWVLVVLWFGFIYGLNLDVIGDEVLDCILLCQGIYQIICLEVFYLCGEVFDYLDVMKQEFCIGDIIMDLLFVVVEVLLVWCV